MIEPAKSGRSSCRTCRKKIAKGELRFGQVDYTFDPDGSFKWHHVLCAAGKLPVELQKALDEFDGDVPDRDEVEKAIAAGRKGNAFPRAEVAKTGRSKCLSCEEKIAKGDLRVVVEREVERVGKKPGYLHAPCAPKFVEGVDDLLGEIKANSDLDADQTKTLETAFS